MMREVFLFTFQLLVDGAEQTFAGKGTNQSEAEKDAVIKLMRSHGVKNDQIRFQEVISTESTGLLSMEELEKEKDHSSESMEPKKFCPACLLFTAVPVKKAFVEAGDYDPKKNRYEEEGPVTQFQCVTPSCQKVYYMN
ncbi:hypothetical protein POF51_29670 [Brevibacillus sp. AG]|uniref:hypothetical protein n=1 Tax=Brevibacillus sp. AG TaxID=3020891 RepID=UPI0023309929|nr:hypothetical protein [Brevibacillus sp. AG]MDC0764893.1 hypothetical protein [Brevibacillus sp. AG]